MAGVTDAQKAKEIAQESVETFFPDATGIHLEEMELDKGKKSWLVTLSFEVTPDTPSELLSNKKTRVFKVFTVESKTGALVSMKNRDMNP